MSRYDGLIIPRSYNDYFSRSRPDDMKQFVRTITDQTYKPAGIDPASGAAINNALANYDKADSYTEDIASIIVNLENGKEVTYSVSDSVVGNPANSVGFVTTRKNKVGNCGVQTFIATQYGVRKQYFRYLEFTGGGDYSGWAIANNWEQLVTESNLINFPITKFSRPNEMWGYYVICGTRCFCHIKFILATNINDWQGIAPNYSIAPAKTAFTQVANGKSGAKNSIYINTNGYISQGGGGGMDAGTYEFDFDYEIA